MKILDISADQDSEPDSKGEYTGAHIDTGPLPKTFTVCSAFSAKAWTGDYSGGDFFTMNTNEGYRWGYINLWAATMYSEIEVKLGPAFYTRLHPRILFPLEWMHACLAVDLVASKVSLVVDGEHYGEVEFEEELDEEKPTNLVVQLGYRCDPFGYCGEDTGQASLLNVHDSFLSTERMMAITRMGGDECGAPGNLVNWEEAEWNLTSTATMHKVGKEWEGPCRRESKIQYFSASFDYHKDCMEHCQKISSGRSPKIITEKDWKNVTVELDMITPDLSVMPWGWFAVTEGDGDKVLAVPDHWPKEELVDGKLIKMEAIETIWRDYYTGQRLEDWPKPWYRATKDEAFGDNSNCLAWYSDMGEDWHMTWYEWLCNTYDQGCPCSYPTQPLLRLRGLCSASGIDSLFTLKQLPNDPNNMILVGTATTQIQWNDTSGMWLLFDAQYDVTAESRATHVSYLLGKHEYTISNDEYECSKGVPYTAKLKLTGCKEEGEFTCDDGQCIKMEERCNQVPDCSDKSDENGCQLILLESNYNRMIPPIARGQDGSAVPVDVSISITLMKVVEIEEVDHSIHLQFQIHMVWIENRVTYHNLKEKISLNALTDYDVDSIWTPLVVYDNTDQKESTRLGAPWEWRTMVAVVRESNFTRSGTEDLDEAEVFPGSGNNLTMTQTYTLEFQCEYKLQRYPFDTQVSTHYGCEVKRLNSKISAKKVVILLQPGGTLQEGP